MENARDVIALVSAGSPGEELLQTLLRVPGLEIRYVVDDRTDVPALAAAREHGVRCLATDGLAELAADPHVTLVIDTTDDPGLLAALKTDARLAPLVVPAAGARLLLRLGRWQREAVAALERQLADSERRIDELSETVAQVPVEKACYVRQASHQIKSPISSIQSYANVLLGGYAGELPDKVRAIVEKIHGRCEAALRALAKSRALADLRCLGPGGLQMSQVSLAELAGRAVEQQADLAARRGVQIDLDPCTGPDLVDCDPAAMTMLLAEIVENAVIYSTAGGRVGISVRAAVGGAPAVVIRDEGMGIPDRCLSRIFDEDFRTDAAKKHYPDGAGLGLTIAREIAALHGARIDVESTEGHGTTVTVTVPSATQG